MGESESSRLPQFVDVRDRCDAFASVVAETIQPERGRTQGKDLRFEPRKAIAPEVLEYGICTFEAGIKRTEE